MIEHIETRPIGLYGAYQPGIEHHDIRNEMNLVSSALESPNAEMLETRLRPLVSALRSHITDEESENGWMAAIAELEPDLAPLLRDLRIQHRGLLTMLDSLTFVDHQSTVATATWIRELIYLFDEHERAEDLVIEKFLLR